MDGVVLGRLGNLVVAAEVAPVDQLVVLRDGEPADQDFAEDVGALVVVNVKARDRRARFLEQSAARSANLRRGGKSWTAVEVFSSAGVTSSRPLFAFSRGTTIGDGRRSHHERADRPSATHRARAPPADARGDRSSLRAPPRARALGLVRSRPRKGPPRGPGRPGAVPPRDPGVGSLPARVLCALLRGSGPAPPESDAGLLAGLCHQGAARDKSPDRDVALQDG